MRGLKLRTLFSPGNKIFMRTSVTERTFWIRWVEVSIIGIR